MSTDDTQRRNRRLGGSYSEWLDGVKAEGAGAPAAPPRDAQVITAPLPIQHAVATNGAIPAAAPAPPPRETGSSAPPKMVAIKEDPVFDPILKALSSYTRPYVAEDKAETNGEPAAAHAVGPRRVPAAAKGPTPEASMKLSDSLVRGVARPIQPANTEPRRTDVPTVTRRTNASRAARPEGDPVATKTRRAPVVVAILAACFAVGAVALWMYVGRRAVDETPPDPTVTSAPLERQPTVVEPAPPIATSEPEVPPVANVAPPPPETAPRNVPAPTERPRPSTATSSSPSSDAPAPAHTAFEVQN